MHINLLNWNSIHHECFIDQVTIDSRRIHSTRAIFVALEGTRTNGHNFVRHALEKGALYAVVRKGFQLEGFQDRLIEVESPLDALQSLAGLYRNTLQTQIVAITGLCGKTMLKDLLSHLFTDDTVFASPESFNSQIGVALSVLSIKSHHKLAFIEAAATKSGEMEKICSFLRPNHVIVTNLSHARISHENPVTSSQEALSALTFLKPNEWALIPKTHLLPQTNAKINFWDTPACNLPFVQLTSDKEHWSIKSPQGDVSTLPLQNKERYYFDLISIGVKAAHLLGLTHQQAVEAFNIWAPEPMRTEVWKNSQGTIFINDSYSKDFMSFDVALRQVGVFEGRLGQRKGIRALLFGGLRDSSSLTYPERDQIARSCVGSLMKKIFVWPKQLKEELAPSFETLDPTVEIFGSDSLQEAIIQAKSEIRPDDLILIKGPKKISPHTILESFEGSTPHNLIIINLAAIQANIQSLRKQLPNNTRLMVMVKALAYGTDEVRIAKFLYSSCGVDILGVSYVEEGVSMRMHGVSCSIFTLHATTQEIEKAIENNLEIGVSTIEQIKAAEMAAHKLQKSCKLHLHVDTGMKRLGCETRDALILGRQIATTPGLIFEGLFTHLVASDSPEHDPFTLTQAEQLHHIYSQLQKENHAPKYCHAANSSATMRFNFPEFNMVRVGLAAYGLHTSKASENTNSLKPAISLNSKIVGFNTATPGETASYGRTHRFDIDTRIAVLPIGYFDGLHRNYSGKGEVIIRGKKAPMVGRICMDYMLVDVQDIPEASIGDQVLIFGEDDEGSYISPEALAHSGGSIVHELITCLGPRIQRLFIYDESLRAR